MKFVLASQKEYKALPKRVKQEIERKVDTLRDCLVFNLRKCESPIEQLLSVHLIDSVEHFLTKNSIFPTSVDAQIIPQSEIEIYSKVYRLDFHIIVEVFDKEFNFAVECDGHDFHEKTKEQARKDKERDRNLQRIGFTIIRFTGSEIWENPFGCSRQVIEIIEKETGIDDFRSKEMLINND